MSQSRIHKLNVLMKIFIHLSFIIYTFNVWQHVFGPIHIPPLSETFWSWEWNTQLIPFYFVGDLIAQYHTNGSWFFWNAVKLSFYNMLLLVPLGVYLSIYKVSSMRKAAAIVFVASLGLEISQMVLSYTGVIMARTFNVDDLILNTVGGGLGYFIFEQLKQFYRSFYVKKKHVSG